MAWDTILRIREKLRQHSIDNGPLRLQTTLSSLNTRKTHKHASCHLEIILAEAAVPRSQADIVIMCNAPFSIDIAYRWPITEVDRRIFELYLPYVFLPYFARKLKKTFVITHFAQTLDGRIASVSGDSKWIGNQQNLIHSHRMRALMDGIIIGSKTLAMDNPKLTVRHVEGDDPCKILIGGDELDIDEFHLSKGEIIIFSQNQDNKNQKIQKHRIHKDKNTYRTRDILDILFQSEIYSVYIEGGSFTTSAFLNQGSIDQVQIHFAPIILGSGITGFNFGGVKSLKEGIHFKSFRYRHIGDQMMFIGELTQ